jgi:pyruvate dehydrogenase E2 component (dihydrolipoamide acetyltransferase)
MAAPIVMPKLGNSVESSIIVGWKKSVGDRVVEGDVIAEVETDKAVQEIIAPASGVLLATFFNAGDDVPVMVNIGAVGEPGEAVEYLHPGSGSQSGSQTPQPAVPQAPPGTAESNGTSAAPAASSGFIAVSPRARGLAERRNLALNDIAGTGPGGRVIERDVRAALERQPKLTPVAQAMVNTGEYIAPPQGTGAGGRVTTRDLLPTKASAPETPAPSAPTPSVMPLKGVRKVIAARMVESLRTTAQLTLNASGDARAIQAYRKRLKTTGKASGLDSITINDMLMFAAARTLLLFPYMNAWLRDGTIYQYDDVHLGFAVDTPRGLIVPVIRNAQRLSLQALSAEAARLADSAQAGTIKPDELDGGTFTVTNLGSLGIESFTPILNPPQVGILGVGAIMLTPMDVDGDVQFIPHIGLSLTIDHQAVDGAPGARFLQALARQIGQFDLLLAM